MTAPTAVRICSVDGCSKQSRPNRRARMCAMHIGRVEKYGSVDLPPGHTPHPLGRSLAERIAAYSEPKPNGCIEWTGYRSPLGYGRMDVGPSPKCAYRVNYELHHGPVPEGLELDHLCRNPACINPDHLEPVTHAENMRRSGPASRTHCPHGHTYDESNTGRTKSGHRYCRRCARDRMRLKARRRAA